jgi:NodT family efflux transporter outer membrane factor (OMF) lipoprotein
MSKFIERRRGFWVFVCSAALAGCAPVGPNFKTPALSGVHAYTRAQLPASTVSTPGGLGTEQAFATGTKVATDWWRGFGSPRLDALIEQSLRNSPSLAAAEATLRNAEQTYAAQSGSTRYPTVNANLGASRNQVNGANQGQSVHKNIFNLYNVDLDVSYTLDLFGGNRRALEALAAKVDYQRFQLAGARLTLAANVATTAFSQAQLGAQIRATEAILKAQQSQLDIARRRFELGAAAKTDVLSLQTQVEQTRASLPALRNKLEQADHLLAVLTGQAPAAVDIPRFQLSQFKLPKQLPVVVPSEWVRGRPDIQASSALLHVATAQYGVEIASLYPHIDLSANLGSHALTTGALFGAGSTVWALAGQLAQPLFNAGLKAGTKAAEASLQAAGANYRETVLQGLRNVADALRALGNDAQALQSQAAADAAAQESLTLVEQQYKLGAVNYLQLLTAQQQAQQARLGLIAAQAQRLADSAALYQAMGGGVLDGSGNLAMNAASSDSAPGAARP